MADVIFQNDDGVVDKKSDREGDGQKREDVDAEAEEVHDGECAEDRNREREDAG